MLTWLITSMIVLAILVVGAIWRFATRTGARVIDRATDDRLISSRSVRGGHGLQIHIEANPANMNLRDLSITSMYLLPDVKRPAGTPSDDLDDWWAWSRSHGGQPVGRVRVVVTIQLLAERAVAIDEPRVLKRRIPTPSGVLVIPTPVGGDGFSPKIFQFNLNATTARPTVEDQSLEHAPFGYKLTRDGTERLDILCSAESGSWEWTVIIPAIVDGKRHELIIDDDGEPFKIIGASGATARFMWSEHKWQSVGL